MVKQLKNFFVAVFLLGSFFSFAQQDIIYLEGTVKDERSGKKLETVNVVLEEDGEVVNTYTTSVNGRFEMTLKFDHLYNVRFNKDGYVSKYLSIDTRNVSENAKTGGFGFQIDMTIFEVVEDVNFDILKKPVGKAAFEEELNDISFDYEYTKSIQAEIAKLRRALEKKYKEEEEQLLAEKKALEEEEAKKEKFDKLVSEGDEQMSQSNYMNAIFKYSDALDLIPGNASVEQKLAKAQAAMEDQKKQQELDAQYAEFIKNADKAFEGENWNEAKTAYTSALNLKPSESYPANKIKVIEAKLKELAEKEALEKQYQDAIAKADKAYNEKDYKPAIDAYNAALSIKKDESYPKEQIAKAEKAIKDKEAKDKLDNDYNAFIKEGDDLLAQSKYEDAISAYKEALELKAGETYPQEKIAEAMKIIADIKAAEEKQRQYESEIEEADKLFAKESYDEAKKLYVAASGYKPEEQYPKDQIKKIDDILSQQQAEAEKNAKYNEAIAKADKEFEAKQWDQATASYQAALAIKSTESYPQEQIDKIKLEKQKIAEAKALEEKYANLIKDADALFGDKKYQESITKYNEALAIKAKEEYPKEQIKKAQEAIEAEEAAKAKDAQYAAIITQADALMNTQSYDDAISKYEEALKLKANEQYPKDQISKAKAALSDIAKAEELQKQYEAKIKVADKAYNGEEWESAKKLYNEALALKDDEYPKGQIMLIDQKLAELMEKEKLDAQYKELIAQADIDFKAKKYEDAKTKYKDASGLKPQEEYPVKQIGIIDDLLAELAAEKALEDKYNMLVEQGDEAFENAEYTKAISSYNEALGVKKNEQYPKDQIAKAEAKINEQKKAEELEAEYQAAMQAGNSKFDQTDYTGAISSYQTALSLKADSQEAKDAIAKAQAKIAEQEQLAEKQRQYQAKISEADLALGAKKYQNSIDLYNEALAILPNEQYPKDKIAEAEAALAAIAAKAEQNEKAYAAAVAYADELFGKEKYLESIGSYESALTFKPEEQYPKDQIEKANEQIRLAEEEAARLAANNVLSQTTDVPEKEEKESKVVSFTDPTKLGDVDEIKENAQNDANKNTEVKEEEPEGPKVPVKLTPDGVDEFRKLLGKNYPEGVTKETIQEGNKTIYRTIIVKDKLGDEYLKVDARFGVFYFQNGNSISSVDFNKGISSAN